MQYNGNVIYGYKKKATGKIVYIGQTVNLEQRHKVHTIYDPYNPNTREYNYPLSRGIRKYGVEEYELVVLEDNIPKNKLNEREKYWIEYYDTYWNGYNQSIGGTYPVRPILDDDKIDIIINMLRDESFSYQDIMDKTGVSITHIYNINTGVRRKRDNISYPIRHSNTKGTRGLKLSPEQNVEVHSLLKNTDKTFEEIGRLFCVKRETISDINAGKTKAYHLDNQNYPIRTLSQTKANNKKLTNEQIQEIITLLLNSSYTFAAIGKQYNVGISTISGINNGKIKSYHLDNINYPIRK